MFELGLVDKLYSEIEKRPTSRIIELYHASSPNLVKTHDAVGEIRK